MTSSRAEAEITEGVAERKVERKSQKSQWKIRNARRAFRTALFRTPFRRLARPQWWSMVVVRAIRVIIILNASQSQSQSHRDPSLPSGFHTSPFPHPSATIYHEPRSCEVKIFVRTVWCRTTGALILNPEFSLSQLSQPQRNRPTTARLTAPRSLAARAVCLCVLFQVSTLLL